MKKLLLITFLILSTSLTKAVTPGSWYAITIAGKGINIPQASLASGIQLQIHTQTNVPSQLWQCVDNGDGTVSLKEGYLNQYLCYYGLLKPGSKLIVRSESVKRYYGDWILIPVEGKANTYNICTTDSLCAIGAASANEDAPLALVDALSGDASLMEWTFTEYTGHVSTSFDTQARDAMIDNYMAHYYHPATSGYVLGGGGWWGDAEMFETILDAFETTGDKKYQDYFQKLVTNFTSRNSTDWSYNTYNDDITWMVLASIRGYKYFNVGLYKTFAINNFDKMYARALEAGGALRWNQETKNWYGSNSCINCPATVAACYLYELTGDASYLDKAKSIYAWQRAHLFVPSTGQVYDSGSWDTTWTTYTVGNTWSSTYNQGTMLGAATKLYQLTGDVMYKNDADKVWAWTLQNLTNSYKIVHVCQTATGDLCGFKGILMRYVRLYGQAFGREDVFQWMEKNAWFAYQNANSKGVVWSKWLTKTTENFMDGDKSFDNDAFGASTAVSVAFNAHINRVFNKNAFSLIGAEIFDDIQFMQISPTFDDDGSTPNTTRSKTGYICFNNVDFGIEGATNATLRLFSSLGGGSYELYVDKISTETKIGAVENLIAGWNTYDISVTTTTGKHTLYAVPVAPNTTMFHNIQFSNPTSGIAETEVAEKKINDNAIYNIIGQRLIETQKGINIINGKKIIIN